MKSSKKHQSVEVSRGVGEVYQNTLSIKNDINAEKIKINPSTREQRKKTEANLHF